MGRVMADCRRFPSETDCSLTIIGDEDEVLQTAAEHARSVHAHGDSVEELREQMRPMLEPEASYQMGTREQEPFPAS